MGVTFHVWGEYRDIAHSIAGSAKHAMVALEIDPAQGVCFGLRVCEFVDECVDSFKV